MLYVDIEKRLRGFTLRASLRADKDVCALFGASGAGKSMTLKCIAGIEKPDRGVIQLNGRTLFDSEKRINLKPQQRRVGYLFQEYALFPNMTVTGNIKAGLHELTRPERENRARDLIKRFRLDGLEAKRPSELSGGEKQRTALARIFASSPEALLLDEPFSSLDDLLKLELIPYIKEAISEFGGETILVSHNVGEVMRLCGTVTPISGGVTGETESVSDFCEEIRVKYEGAGMIPPTML